MCPRCAVPTDFARCPCKADYASLLFRRQELTIDVPLWRVLPCPAFQICSDEQDTGIKCIPRSERAFICASLPPRLTTERLDHFPSPDPQVCRVPVRKAGYAYSLRKKCLEIAVGAVLRQTSFFLISIPDLGPHINPSREALGLGVGTFLVLRREPLLSNSKRLQAATLFFGVNFCNVNSWK